MNVHVTSSVQGTSSLSQVRAVSTVSDGAGGAQGVGGIGLPQDTLEVSGPGELFAKLQELQETDPEKFQEVCAGISAQLSEAAEEAGDTREGAMLSELADKFQSVAEGGDISQLQPPPPPPPGGGPAGMVGKYQEQDDDAIGSLLSGARETDPQTTLEELMSSIIEQVSAALEEAQGTSEV